MSSTVQLHLAIYNGDGVYKHWGLLVDKQTKAEKTLLNIMGFSTNYRFEMKSSKDQKWEIPLKMVYLCDADPSQVRIIKDVAKNAVIHNESPCYNCQDYVLDLLDALEEKGVIDGSDVKYQKNKEVVKDMQEGLK